MSDNNNGSNDNLPELPEGNHTALIEKEQKQVTRVYAAMVAMVIFSCIPSLPAQILAFILLVYVMVSAYGLRRKSDKESLTWNHMEFLIRTFWISSLIFLIGFAADIIYLSDKLDINSINAMSDGLMQGQLLAVPGMHILIMASVITLGPSLVYFIYRIAKGLSRAVQGFRMGNVKHWF